ncbi:MAG: ATP-binding cassette domain-containing protein [Breznakibacter sp.]|nr:ATP-binding cassette domain-containing protein [Breznakibacter sp.]
MSEGILKALMQLFALVSFPSNDSQSRRSIVHSFLDQQLNSQQVQDYIHLFDQKIEEIESKMNEKDKDPQKRVASNSVRVLRIASEVNEQLTNYQKVIVLIQLIEFIKSGEKIIGIELEFLSSVAQSFNISFEDYTQLSTFILNKFDEVPKDSKILSLVRTPSEGENISREGKLFWDNLTNDIKLLSLNNYEVLLLRVPTDSEFVINGQPINPARVHILTPGSSIRDKKIKPIYYNDIVSKFSVDQGKTPIYFDVKNISFKFKNNAIGIHPMSISTKSGKLVGILGSSGSGKSTLVNILSGIYQPSEGNVYLNGIDIHEDADQIKGLIGFVSQDDLLMEDLTVFQNLYFNARLCFADHAETEIIEHVNIMLKSLGLYDIREMKVGDPLNKKISGGQRKRLNIALELIREPAVLFLDEPTSGLSSRDSENIMDLLKELTLRGKLIFVVIHQPSSDIFKMLSQLVVLDEGGRLIYNGDPVEAISYFKHCTHHANPDENECTVCGNVNSEQILNIIYSQVLDEYGNSTNTRKTSSEEWYQTFISSDKNSQNANLHKTELPLISFKTPTRREQFTIFSLRDILSKYANKQYLIINLLEVPALALLLASIIRYFNINSPDGRGYVFADNPNVTVYIIISVIISLFVGMSLSAEEIINDRKILNREKFLNLSWLSYLFSKSSILIGISAIQSLLYVLIGNTIIDLKGMYFSYWLILFSSAVFANLLGLNISATLKKAVNIYILIPFLLIPQLILSGVFISYDRLNPTISKPSGIPWYGELITARWAFEALAVNQFVNNKYETEFYKNHKLRSQAKFQIDYKIPSLKNKVASCNKLYEQKKTKSDKYIDGCELLLNEMRYDTYLSTKVSNSTIGKLEKNIVDGSVLSNISKALASAKTYHSDIYNKQDRIIDKIVALNEKSEASKKRFRELKLNYHNEDLERFVRNTNNFFTNKIVEYDGQLIQKVDPIFNDPDGALFNAHFLAPQKSIFVANIPTFWFNFVIIWLMNTFLFVALYKQWLYKITTFSDRLKQKMKRG